MIGGIVLAAGLSERMGGLVPKQLLEFGGDPMVAISVRNAEASSLDHVVVVTGHRAAEVGSAVAGGRAVIAENAGYLDGNMTSFRVGFAALPECEAYVILLADMPGVTTEMIDLVTDRWRTAMPWAAVASYADRRGHPLLLSAVAMGAAITAEGAKGVWRFLMEAPGGEVVDVRFDQPRPPDINTPEDYSALFPAKDF